MAEIEVREVRMLHSGGTKFYTMIVVSCTGYPNSVLMKRWGKIASRNGGGERHFEEFRESGVANRVCDGMIRKKHGREYVVEMDFIERGGAAAAMRRQGIDEGMVNHILRFVTGAPTEGENEVVVEIINGQPPVDRSGDKEWASW